MIEPIDAIDREMTFEIGARFNDAAHYSRPAELIVFVCTANHICSAKLIIFVQS